MMSYLFLFFFVLFFSIFKVANQKGGSAAAMQVAFLWSKSLGADSAVKLLNKMNLLQACIDYACETYQVSLFPMGWL